MSIIRQIQNIELRFKNQYSKPNENVIFLLGFSKSGTTVAINLLSELTGLSYTHDSKYLQRPF